MRGGVMRRETLWFGGIEFSQALATAGTAVLVSTLNAAALALRPFTVIRTRGMLHIDTDNAAAAEHYSAAFGMAVVSDQAAAIGVTAVPTPVTDSGSNLWFVYDWLFGSHNSRTDVGQGTAGFVKEIDSKAMRKVESGSDLAVVIERGAITAGCTLSGFARNLVKLH